MALAVVSPGVMTERVLRRAEIVAVGSELLGAQRTDTNSLHITQCLNDLGIDVVAKAVVGDRFDDLVAVCRVAIARADLVVLTGGLGPTEDDLTREAVAHLLGRTLHEDASALERIRARFASRQLTMPESNRRQALVIAGATLIHNERGTAPGQWLEADGRLVVLLPGPPREMQPMLGHVAETVLPQRVAGDRYLRRSVRLVGRSESQFDELLKPLYEEWARGDPPIEATILAASGMIELQLRARHASGAAATQALAGAAAAVGALLGTDVVSDTGRTLEQVVGDLLRAQGLRVAVAESCTGGLMTSRLTDVAGSSDYVECSFVVYANRAKTTLLGVSEELIREHGAVSESVALAMASGARERGGADVGVGITGIAGPGGGSPTKPVGTVAIAIEGPAGRRFVRTFLFPGTRDMIKVFASTTALDRLRRQIRE
ncbi:MAG: competence/damage-inducible protein A [Vicinamibacterales bacterium]